jgi:NDP-sugar pyrophosphorylase family protein
MDNQDPVSLRTDSMKSAYLDPRTYFTPDSEEVEQLIQGVRSVLDLVRDVQSLVAKLVHGQHQVLGQVMAGAHVSEAPMYVAESAIIEPGACILGPAYIGPDVVIRHGAYVRSNVIMLSGSLLGHASEAKACIFLPKAKAPHFAYVGDSVLGHRVNLGAGTKLSNLAITSSNSRSGERRPNLLLRVDGGEPFDTGLTKLGAILGDDVQTGCDTVLAPGTLIGPRCLIYANASVRKGIYGTDLIAKTSDNLSWEVRK